MAGIYEEDEQSHLFVVCSRYHQIDGIKILPQGKYLCADCTEENRKQTIDELYDAAKRHYQVIPEFTIQLIVLSGILQWNYQAQVFLGT